MNPSNRQNSDDSQSSEPTKIITLGKTTVLNNPIDANLASALGYLPIFPLSVIFAFILLNSPSESHNFNRFHATQSLVLGGVLLVLLVVNGILGTMLSAIPLLGVLLALPFHLLGALLPLA